MKKCLFLLPLLSACTLVSPGQTGVRVILGEVQDEPLYSGVYFWFPVLYSNYLLNTRILKNEVQTVSASSDMQNVFTTVALNWSVDPSKVPKIYKEIGNESDVYSRIIIPAINETMKYATAQLSAEQILKRRIDLKEAVDKNLSLRLEKYGVLVHDLSFMNFHFSDDFSASVERKQIAEQRALEAKYEAEKATQDAFAEIERAKGSAEAQKLMKASLTPDLLKLEAIRKWDGRLPTTLASDDAKLFIGNK